MHLAGCIWLAAAAVEIRCHRGMFFQRLPAPNVRRDHRCRVRDKLIQRQSAPVWRRADPPVRWDWLASRPLGTRPRAVASAVAARARNQLSNLVQVASDEPWMVAPLGPPCRILESSAPDSDPVQMTKRAYLARLEPFAVSMGQWPAALVLIGATGTH